MLLESTTEVFIIYECQFIAHALSPCLEHHWLPGLSFRGFRQIAFP